MADILDSAKNKSSWYTRNMGLFSLQRKRCAIRDSFTNDANGIPERKGLGTPNHVEGIMRMKKKE